jgi:hypothetical protein
MRLSALQRPGIGCAMAAHIKIKPLIVPNNRTGLFLNPARRSYISIVKQRGWEHVYISDHTDRHVNPDGRRFSWTLNNLAGNVYVTGQKG